MADDDEQYADWLKNSFSFIHMRNVSIIDWDYLMGQMFRYLSSPPWYLSMLTS